LLITDLLPALRRRPVILVNGMTSRVDHYADIRDYLKQRGYRDEELYGTTFGSAGNVSMFSVTMECDFSRRIRELIVAVNSFTNSKVDILAFSMGSPVARKAILGGICVDTGEELGAPLTSHVDTFVSVAGPNHGSFLCVFSFIRSCNALNGLICSSTYLADINSVKRYEGSRIFTIYSKDDEFAGYEVCGRLTTPIDGQDQGYEVGEILVQVEKYWAQR
uniref:DUF676 domain-containing protein n=1 Tax=Anisakis simplex TaxID=6269 RepID=A0A0M3J638_ANISI